MAPADPEEPEDTPLSIAAAWMLGIGFLAFVAGIICILVGLGLTAAAPEACAGQTVDQATGPCRLPFLWLKIGAFGSVAGGSSAALGLAYFGGRKLLKRLGRG